MRKRKWIIETTDHIGPISMGEYFWNDIDGTIDRAGINMKSNWQKLDVTEVCLNHSLALPCQICERIEKEYLAKMAEWKEQGD